MNLWLRGRGGWKGTVRGLGKVMYTLLYLRWITNKDALYSPGNAAQCGTAAWMGAGFGGEWTRGWLPESLCCSPETTVTQFIGYTRTHIGFRVRKNPFPCLFVCFFLNQFLCSYSPSPIWFRQGIYFLSLVKV